MMLLNLLLALSLIALQDLAGSGYSPLGTTTAFLALVVLLLATLFYVLSPDPALKSRIPR